MSVATIEKIEVKKPQVPTVKADVPKTYRMTISSAGQVTLPKAVREQLGVGPGDMLEVDIAGSVLELRKMSTLEEQVDAMFAEFDRINEESKKRMTPEQKEFAEMTKGWTVNQFHEYFDNLPETKAYIKEKYGV